MKKVPVGFRFDPELISRLREIAKNEGRILNSIVESVLTRWVKSKIAKKSGR